MTSAISGLSAALYEDEADEYVVVEQGSNKGMCFVSLGGTPSLEIVVSGNDTPLSVDVAVDVVTVNSATDADGDPTSTAAEIVAAVNADAEANLIFFARLSPGSSGAGVPGAFTETEADEGVPFIGLALVDSGDHLTFQAAAGSRCWDDDVAATITDNGSPASGYSINYMRGSVTFETTKSGHTVLAAGTRRSEYAFQKVMGLFDGKMTINGKEIDTTSCDDDGWGSSIMGASSWEMTAGHFYYAGQIPLDRFKAESFWKFYSVAHTVPFAMGKGALQGIENILASANDAQKQTITVKGQGEIWLL